MNEKITNKSRMANTGWEIEKIISVIADNMLKTRPKKDVYYMPYQPVKGVTSTLSRWTVDINKIYPDADEGSVVFVDFEIKTEKDYEIFLNIIGNVEVYFEGQHILTCTEQNADRDVTFQAGLFNLPITVKADGKNFVRIKCEKRFGEFGFSYNLSIRRYPGMWASDYIYTCRSIVPAEGLYGENGFALSELYQPNTPYNITPEYALPKPPTDNNFDFSVLCGSGDTAYVYTVAKHAHRLEIEGSVDTVWVNREIVESDTNVQSGDIILIKSVRQGCQWSLKIQDDNLHLPFLTSNRGIGDKAIWIGPFYGQKMHPPEYDIDFSKVIRNTDGQDLYWKFCDNSALRIQLDSVFYGQWFYALMVGFYGIRKAGASLGNLDYQRLFCDNMHFMAKYFKYIQYDASNYGMPSFMPRSVNIHDLDSTGTMGMNFIDAYNDSGDTTLLDIIDRLKVCLQERIPRFPDGTFYRVETMWADDVFMSCPFIARLSALTGNDFWLEEMVQQIRGFRKRLFIEKDNIFSHIFFVQQDTANNVAWGRGNGWIMWTLSEILPFLKDRESFVEMLDLFRRFAKGVQKLQHPTGLWRQVLNLDDQGSYPETSCTAMFMLAFVRGVKNGWLDDSFVSTIERAWQGLLQHSIDDVGNVYGVCMGSGRSMDASYYYEIPTIKNDDHGTGIILAAASELMMYKKI